jgi:ATP-dependent RNA helicase DDX19/DBP5
LQPFFDHFSSGKTGAFSIGMVCKCDPGVEQPQALCLAPTREIAIQTADRTVQILGNSLGLKVFKAIKDVEATAPITEQLVVGTPGTVAHLIKKGLLNLSKVKIIVIDEADTMVEMDLAKREEASQDPKKKKKDMTRTVLDIKK